MFYAEDKARFLDACPHLVDDIQAIDKALGRKPQVNWNAAWGQIEDALHKRKSRWKTSEQKLFRSVLRERTRRLNRSPRVARAMDTNRIPTCVISKISRSRTISISISNVTYFPMCLTHGWTEPRTRRDMKSILTDTFISTPTRVPWN